MFFDGIAIINTSEFKNFSNSFSRLLKLIINGCDTNGRCQSDQYLRLFDASNKQIASNDDFCSVCSQIRYILTQPCQTYSIHEGCYSTGSCSGIISISSTSTSTRLVTKSGFRT